MGLQTARLTLLTDPDRKEGFRRFGALRERTVSRVVLQPTLHDLAP